MGFLLGAVLGVVLGAQPPPSQLPIADANTPGQARLAAGGQLTPTGSPTSLAGQEQPPTARPAGQQQEPSPQGTPPSADQLPVSIDHIRKELQSAPPPPLLQSGLHFKVEVHAREFTWPDFKDSLDFRGEPVPPGGIYHYEFLHMVTPPEFQSPAAVVGVDPGSIVNAIRQAWHDAAERRAREEVQRELEALKKAQEAEKKQ